MAGKLLDETGLSELWSIITDKYGRYNLHWWAKIGVSYSASLGGTTTLWVIFAKSGTQNISYADSVSVDASGNILLNNPQTVTLGITSAYATTASVLQGKYFVPTYENTSNTIYFCPPSSVPYYDSASAGSGIRVTAQTVSAVAGYSTDYIYSADRNAYPDKGTVGGLVYKYLGVPFANMVGAPKIAAGSYIGTGTSGSSGPCSLTFEFEPELVFVCGFDDSVNPAVFVVHPGAYSSYAQVGKIIGGSYNNAGNMAIKMVDNTLYWYSSDLNKQANRSGYTYYYVAIG